MPLHVDYWECDANDSCDGSTTITIDHHTDQNLEVSAIGKEKLQSWSNALYSLPIVHLAAAHHDPTPSQTQTKEVTI